MTSKRTRPTLVNAFNLVPVVEQILPDRPKIEVGLLGQVVSVCGRGWVVQ